MNIILLVLGLLLFSGVSRAATCESAREHKNYVNLSLSIARDLPVNSTFFKEEITKAPIRVVCSRLGNYNLSMALTGPLTDLGNHVYATGIPGVGMRVLWDNPKEAGPLGGIYMGPFKSVPLGRGLNEYFSPHRFTFELIKTGPMSSGHSKDLAVDIWYSDALVHKISFSNTQLTISNMGCKVAEPVQSVELDPIHQRALPSVGSSAGAKGFAIKLTCDKGVKIAYRVDGINSRDHILLNDAGAGMAQGVGLQLLRGDAASTTLQLLGARTDVITVPTTEDGQAVSIPLAARYYRTSSDLKAGLIATRATVTLIYE